MSANPTSDPSGIYKDEADFFNRWAQSVRVEDIRVHDAFEAPTAPENKLILRRMGDLRGRRLLDVGAGLGESSVYFALQGAEVTATDISPGMVDFAKRLAQHHGTSISGVVCPAEQLAVPDASFDLVYVANSIHHMPDKDRFFREVSRVLKPGGRFFSWDPVAYNPIINVYRRMATEVRTENEAPLRVSDLRRVRQHFVNVGHREFWIATLALFIKYYLLDRVHPNQDRYWKRIFKETPRSLWWWYPLFALDALLTRLPFIRFLAWNIVIWGEKPQGAPAP
ncbi:MAG TPA: class I SAM-dependent methyltransferase [Kiritimatiellia bacterium]|nr:class I SAM-dependent methyltransferase [Kiritimatiellia bacterium]